LVDRDVDALNMRLHGERMHTRFLENLRRGVLEEPRARGRCVSGRRMHVSGRRMHVSAELSCDSLGTCAEALFCYWEILEFVAGGEGEYVFVAGGEG
jgi:hypothetical protein